MGTDHRRRIRELVAEADAASTRTGALRPPRWPECAAAEREAYLAAATEMKELRATLRDGPDGQMIALRDGRAGPDAVGYALAYLDVDPYYIGSGYIKQRTLRHLGRARLTAEQRTVAAALVERAVTGDMGWEIEWAHLAGVAADNRLRRALRAHLHDADVSVGRRAMVLLQRVRRPGHSTADIERMHQLILDDARRGPLRPLTYRIAARLWSPEWAQELRETAAHHGPDRAGAERVLDAMARRRAASERKERERAGL